MRPHTVEQRQKYPSKIPKLFLRTRLINKQISFFLKKKLPAL